MDPKQEADMCIQTRVKLEKNLASPDKAKREKAMSLLCLWLTSQKIIKEEELAKIWKGLFYCLLHAEKPAAQEDLVERMATLIEKLDVDLSLLFFKVFLTSLRNEWASLDETIISRFQLLLKQSVSHMFSVMRKNNWDLEVVKNFTEVLAERALLIHNASNALGMNVYISGLFLDELRQYLPIPADIFKELLEPFWEALSKGCDDTLAEEICTKVFIVLLDDASRGLICDKEFQVSDEKEKGCFGDLTVDLVLSTQSKSSALLSLASGSKSVQLQLIEEKFNRVAELVQAQVSISSSSMNAFNGQIVTQTTNPLAEIVNETQNPSEKQSETQSFDKNSKRNPKLVCSPQTVEHVYEKKSVEKSGTLMDRKPTQKMTVELNTRQVSDNASQGNSTHSQKNKADIAASESGHNLENAEIINMDGSPSKQGTVTSDDSDSNNLHAASDDAITMEDPVILNLAKRFESFADQSPCCEADISSFPSTPLAPSPINTGGRKRKNCKSSFLNDIDSESPTSTKENDVVMSHDLFKEDDATSIDNLSAKKAKKVHFSLQHNIVWRPSTPLPPHDVRVPPAATPRGSALKKGVPPGPIIDLMEVSVSPKKKKRTPKKTPSAHLKSPKRVKNPAKVTKSSKRGRLSPR